MKSTRFTASHVRQHVKAVGIFPLGIAVGKVTPMSPSDIAPNSASISVRAHQNRMTFRPELESNADAAENQRLRPQGVRVLADTDAKHM